MKKQHSIITFYILLFTINISGQYDSLYHNEIWRNYLVHLPANYDQNANIKYPLVLVLHGGFGNAYNIEEQSQFSSKSDTAKVPFIVVYPEGVKSPLNISTWNAGGCCGYAASSNVDDVGFISALLDTIEQKYLIDVNRIYASGMSNGGMMTYRLAAELNYRFAAVAPVASVMVNENKFEPNNAIPIIHFHSFLDNNVPIDGGLGDGFANYTYPPLDSILNIWANLNSCSIFDTVFNDNEKYLHETWTNCRDKNNIVLYVTYDGGHSWPGGTVPRIGGDQVSKQINATDLIWDFFQQHSRENTTKTNFSETLISEFELYQNYPNPFNPVTNIEYKIPYLKNRRYNSNSIRIIVYDILGKEVQTLVNETSEPQKYKIQFDASNLASGIYFYRLYFNNLTKTKVMTVIK